MRAAGLFAFAAALALTAGCHRAAGADQRSGDGGDVSAPSTVAPGAPRTGMVWIPTGTLRAGSPLDEVPRLADVELPGTEIPLGGFYIDVLPWPDEASAIPTMNVSRDEAERLCETKGKRLCSELEWERACKGPDNLRYEYGAAYDARVCSAGQAESSAARHPSGDRPACKSAFGVREMHGGGSEWTGSSWGRGSQRDAGVIRGGNDTAGEIASRCAFARAMSPESRSPSTGFRCCAGPRNDAEVQLEVKTGVPFQKAEHTTRTSPPLDALQGVACGPPLSPAPCSLSRAWTWRPSPNVELSLAGGCVGRDPSARCALAVSRLLGDRSDVLAQIDTGREIPEVVLVEGMDRRIRVRGADMKGQFFREIIYSYGRVDVREVH
jgi:formylglycine-generating enzyme required for sulfatase activity